MSHHRPPLCLYCGRPHWEGVCRQEPSLKERVRVKLTALMNAVRFGRNGHRDER